jgi:pyruvate kinase
MGLEEILSYSPLRCFPPLTTRDEVTLGNLLDAGMDIIRLNFSHGDHDAHYEVLQRFRKVVASVRDG